MMRKILAIDAGGTTTRAAVVDLSGNCLGFGRAGGGNPTAAGIDAALASLETATRMAAAGGCSGTDDFSSALIAMAGAGARVPRGLITERLTELGLRGNAEIESDILATFCSGTWHPRGYALIAGTGAVAARIDGGEVDRVSDGAGWLLGDAGSGFWIGRQVVRAVVAALDERASQTALTNLLLASLQLTANTEIDRGRPSAVLQLIELLYTLQPVELSRFAPLAFEAEDDPVANGVLSAAATELANTLSSVQNAAVNGPVVLGGSILAQLIARTSLTDELTKRRTTEFIPVQDGIVGAVVLGLRRAGIQVDDEIFERVGRSVEFQRKAVGMNGSGP